jgi:hypothetical protein
LGLTCSTDGIGLMSVTTHAADAAGLTTLTARTVTFEPTAAARGAVYFPVASIVPTVELPPATSLTVHVMAVLAAPSTVAINRRSPPSGTFTAVGETRTVCAPAGAAAAAITRSTPSVSRLWPSARMDFSSTSRMQVSVVFLRQRLDRQQARCVPQQRLMRRP